MGLAFAYEHERQNGELPGQVILGRGVILVPARQVAEDTPGLFGGWVIHKADFRAPKILAIARLQAWTLKPAIRRDDNVKQHPPRAENATVGETRSAALRPNPSPKFGS